MALGPDFIHRDLVSKHKSGKKHKHEKLHGPYTCPNCGTNILSGSGTGGAPSVNGAPGASFL